MSEFTALGALVALGIANGFLFVFMDKWVKDRAGTIVTGCFEGMRMPFERRRYLLQVEIILNSGALIVIEGMLAIGWLMIGRNASGSDVRLFAYLLVFINTVGAVGWLATARAAAHVLRGGLLEQVFVRVAVHRGSAERDMGLRRRSE